MRRKVEGGPLRIPIVKVVTRIPKSLAAIDRELHHLSAEKAIKADWAGCMFDAFCQEMTGLAVLVISVPDIPPEIKEEGTEELRTTFFGAALLSWFPEELRDVSPRWMEVKM